MEKAVYFILILCGILSLGICHVTEENMAAAEKSSDVLMRQKRVVEGSIRRLGTSPYMLHVFLNGSYHCPATLLTADFVISSATCFINHNTQSLRIRSRPIVGGYQLHEVVRVFFLDPHYNPAHPTVNNLALVRFAQPIYFSTSYNRPIRIYSGNLAADYTTTRIIGWGKSLRQGTKIIPAEHLQTFAVMMLSIEYCQGIYPNVIGKGNICATGQTPRENCDNSDTGAPLVKEGGLLLGIFVYRCEVCPVKPLVFMNMLDGHIRRWIHQHIPSLRLF